MSMKGFITFFDKDHYDWKPTKEAGTEYEALYEGSAREYVDAVIRRYEVYSHPTPERVVIDRGCLARTDTVFSQKQENGSLKFATVSEIGKDGDIKGSPLEDSFVYKNDKLQGDVHVVAGLGRDTLVLPGSPNDYVVSLATITDMDTGRVAWHGETPIVLQPKENVEGVDGAKPRIVLSGVEDLKFVDKEALAKIEGTMTPNDLEELSARSGTTTIHPHDLYNRMIENMSEEARSAYKFSVSSELRSESTFRNLDINFLVRYQKDLAKNPDNQDLIDRIAETKSDLQDPSLTEAELAVIERLMDGEKCYHEMHETVRDTLMDHHVPGWEEHLKIDPEAVVPQEAAQAQPDANPAMTAGM